MSRSFGTLVQLSTLLKVCIKLGLTRDSRMPDLGSVQGANKKASEYGAGRDPGLFTELFTARYTAVTIASAPCYGHFGSLSRFTKPEDGGGRRGGVLGRCKFSPSFDYIISEPLKDKELRRSTESMTVVSHDFRTSRERERRTRYSRDHGMA